MPLQLLEERPAPLQLSPAPLLRRARPGGQGRQHKGTAVTLVAVLLVGVWLLGGFWTSVQLRSPRAPYPSAVAGQAWARSPEPGAWAFFRLSFPITTLPLTATLWVDADQVVTPYLNGFRVRRPPRAPAVRGPGQPGPGGYRPGHPRASRHGGLVAGAGPGDGHAGPGSGQPGQPGALFSSPHRAELRLRDGGNGHPARGLAVHHQRGVDCPGLPRVGDVQRA